MHLLAHSSLGVMQGRLSAVDLTPYQYFPADTWEYEFPMCRERNLNHIEWVVDNLNNVQNPLNSDPSRILHLIAKFNIQVPSVCADFFMVEPIAKTLANQSQGVLKVLQNMKHIGARFLVVPFLENNAISNQPRAELLSSLARLTAAAGPFDINIAMETDLAPLAFRKLLDDSNLANLSVNYDIGNSAAMGFDPSIEIDLLARDVSVIHVKDRLLGGHSVELGTGAANVVETLLKLFDDGVQRVVTLQTCRDANPPDIFDSQLKWLLAELREVHEND